MHHRAQSMSPRFGGGVWTHVLIGCCGIALGLALASACVAPPALVAGSQRSESGECVLLDFTATWCQPCQRMSPVVANLERQGYPIRRVDVDRERALAEQYGIKTIPTFVLVVNGREVMRQTGETTEAQLRRMLLQIPDWQRELSRRDQVSPARTKTASASPTAEMEAVPTPFVELNEASLQPGTKPTTQDSQPRFTLPFIGALSTTSPAPSARESSAVAQPVVRGQSRDQEPTASQRPFDPLRVSARLRVKDEGSLNYGSGTIVESRAGRSLILTCGHLFRDLSPAAVVEVDVFEPGRKPETYLGKVLDFDLTADVGLVAIPTLRALPTATLSTLEALVSVGENAVSVGCDGGEVPSRQVVQITALNKYDGPDNIECTGMPIPGRSGGGLFRGNTLIGICIAADPKEQRGLYCGLRPIYELLQKTGLSHLLPGKRQAAVVADAEGAGRAAVSHPAKTEDRSEPQPLASVAAASQAPGSPANSPFDATFPTDSATNIASGDKSPQIRAVRDELRDWPDDAEVICIVRPKNSQAPSRVVIIHQATPKLLSYLQDASGPASELVHELPRAEDSLIPTSGSKSAEWHDGLKAQSVTEKTATSSGALPRRPPSPRPR